MSIKKGKETPAQSEEKNEQDILKTLQEKLAKGDTVANLTSELGISEYELFGYVRQIKDTGINVTFTEKGDEVRLSINHQPDFTTENVYRINTDNPNTKIGVISDLRFGSKNEQIAMLNDMYRKFAADGVTHVIIAGNLLEGKYNKTYKNW